MQLIIKDDKILATHENHQDVTHLYPNTECIQWDEPIEMLPPMEGPTPDPRTEQQKKDAYLDKRRVAYPSCEDQLGMLYHDTLNKTTIWVDAIMAIKEQYPKPELQVE